MTLTPSREFSTEYFATYQFFEVPDCMSVLKKHQVDTRKKVKGNWKKVLDHHPGVVTLK